MEGGGAIGGKTDSGEGDEIKPDAPASTGRETAAANPSTSINKSLEITPKPNDILLGRGLPFQAHPGTQLMRRIVAEHRETYKSLPRQSRGDVVNKILRVLKSKGCRFLVRRNRSAMNQPSGGWELATEGEAYDKVCHALRSKIGQRAATGDAAGLASTAQNRQIENAGSQDSSPAVASSELSSGQPSTTSPTGDEDAKMHNAETCLNDLVDTSLAVRMAIDEYLSKSKDS